MRGSGWPLVGREDELASLLDRLHRVADGRGACVVVAAPTGVGKTHLLDALAAEAEARSMVLRRATAHAGVVAPFAVVAAALHRPVPPSPDPVRPSIIEAGTSTGADAWMVEQYLDVVDRLVLDGPVVLIVDDAHVADPASVAVLQAVHERLALLPVLLVVGCRPPDPASPFGRWWPVVRAGADVIDLGPLGDDALRTLCVVRLGRPPGPMLLRRLQGTGGLPLLATATLDALADTLAETSGGTSVDAPAGDDVAAGELVELDAEAERRLAGTVPDPVRSRLEAVVSGDTLVAAAAAIAGPSFSAADVADVLETPLIEVLDVVGRLERAGLVVVRGADHAFRHEQFRIAATQLVSAATKAALHRRFADVLGRRGESPLMVADHVLTSGSTGADAAVWLRRAAELLMRSDVPGALALVDRAMAIDPAPDRRLHMLRYRALSGLGRVDEAEAIARRLLADRLDPDDEVALRREVAVALFVDGRANASIDELRRAADLESDLPARRRLLAEQAFIRLLSGDFDGARIAARTAIGQVEALGDRRTRRDVIAQLGADMVNGLVTLYAGELDQAEAIAARIVEMAELPGTDEATLYQPWFSASVVRLELGDFAVARRINGVGRARSIASGYFWAVPGYDALDAAVHFQQGNLDDATASAQAAIGAGVRDAYGANLWAASIAARCSILRGDWDGAREQLAIARSLVRPEQAQLGVDHLTMAELAMLEAVGDVEGAASLAAGSWDVFDAFGLDTPRQELSLDVVRLAALTGDRARVVQVSRHLERVAEVTGRRRFALDAELGSWIAATAGSTVLGDAAVATRDRLAAAYAGLGHGVRSFRLDRRGPARPATGDDPAVLTRSERAVAQLLADGLTNTQIASRLVISRRTVESHVSAAYRKLGVTNRVELARRIRALA